MIGCYRGKWKLNDTWVMGDLIHELCGTMIQFYDEANRVKALIYPETVCFFTGCRDKNKVGVFTDDIFKFEGKHGVVNYGIVKYRKDYNQYRSHNCCGFVIEWLEKGLREDLPFWCETQSNAYIVGNIYDHSHLIEQWKRDRAIK